VIAREARRILEFMAGSAATFNRAYASLLAQDLEQIRLRPDSYLLHEHLAEINEPVYFHEMFERAAAKGLRFLSEVQSGLVDVEIIAPAMAAGLREFAADDVEFEQFLDFLINRNFRASVFCHAGAELRQPPRDEDLAGLGVSAQRAAPSAQVAFRNEPLLRGALEHLAENWPSAVPWGSLARSAVPASARRPEAPVSRSTSRTLRRICFAATD
jgi:hypothetical protein